ncbi:Peroxisomal adenine nucleotide transporter 1 [Rhodotorula toruloides]|nr:Peroxisomal adenine nucleotide transporter 1 [Rhodotorula toruloides]
MTSSGSLGAVVSNALVFPLDTLTTRLQTSKRSAKKAGSASRAGSYNSLSAAVQTIYRHEGLSAFYSGLGPDSLSTALSQFLYFLAYSALRDRFQARKARQHPPTAAGKDGKKSSGPPLLSALEELAIGCLAGIFAKGVVSPLSMITVRAQTSSEPRQEVVGGKEGDKRAVESDDSGDEDDGGYGRASSALAIGKEIYQEQGLWGFWSGFGSTVILSINPAITFYGFAALKRLLPKKNREHPTPAQTFLCGALASAIASALTYPLILAKTRMQFKSPTGRALYRSQFDVFRKTIAKQGVAGLYQGVESQLLKGFFSEGVKLLVKDRARFRHKVVSCIRPPFPSTAVFIFSGPICCIVALLDRLFLRTESVALPLLVVEKVKPGKDSRLSPRYARLASFPRLPSRSSPSALHSLALTSLLLARWTGSVAMRVLDPYPGAETWPLDFSLADLHTLTSQELLSVHLHPLATKADKEEAKAIFWQRRVLAFGQGREEGLAEATAELRQMKRAEEWLAGRAPGSRGGGDNTEERNGSGDGGRKRRRKESGAWSLPPRPEQPSASSRAVAVPPPLVEILTLPDTPSPPPAARSESTRLPLTTNPAPFAETWRLNFSLDDLDSLPSYQLLAVQAHPFAATFHRREARQIYRSRRRLALDLEAGAGSSTGENAKSQQVRKAQDWLAGRVPGKASAARPDVQTGQAEDAGQSKKKRKNASKSSSGLAGGKAAAAATSRTSVAPLPPPTTSTNRSSIQLPDLSSLLLPLSAPYLPTRPQVPLILHRSRPPRPVAAQSTAKPSQRKKSVGQSKG